jgi:hypothetical protein
MKRAKKITVLFILTFCLAVALSYFPSRSRTVSITNGFRYGEPANQSEAQADGTFVRNWQGFPVTIRETETVKYPSESYYESTVYEIQHFSTARLIANVIFWVGLMTALLAPITIFYRPKQKAQKLVKNQDSVPTSNEVISTHIKKQSHIKNHANTRD